VARSGDHFLWDEATAWSDFDHGAGSVIHRAYLDEEIEEIPTPGLHHAFFEHEDTTLAWGSVYHGSTLDSEALVELAPGAKTPTILWDCFDDWLGYAWNCESNTIYYDAGRDTYLYSFYTNNTMVELSRSTGQTLWWAGAEAGGRTFIPAASQFDWQHGVNWTPQGTLLVSSRATDSQGVRTTRLYEYDVDDTAGTLSLIWQYDAEVHAQTNGDSRRLPNGNTLHGVGSAGQIHEVNAAGQPVWILDYQDTRLTGRAEHITDLYDLLSP